MDLCDSFADRIEEYYHCTRIGNLLNFEVIKRKRKMEIYFFHKKLIKPEITYVWDEKCYKVFTLINIKSVVFIS